MQLWDKILQMALLGSERSHLDPALGTALRRYRIDPEDPLPQLILTAAATLNQVRKLRINTTDLSHLDLDLAPDEDQDRPMPPPALKQLEKILSGSYRPVLPEFVRLSAERQWLLPPEFLPDLLDNCLQDRESWAELQPLLGKRAEWLIGTHPQWKILLPKGEASRWPVAGHEERLQILGYLRVTDPEAAIPLLESIWQDISYSVKLAYLDLSASGLSLADEYFLETVLEDGRKEVRLKAADLLATLPGSRLTKRIFNTLHPLFAFDAAKKRLNVELPKDIPASKASDGVQPRVTKGKKGGLKASWLYESVSRIPVQYWLDHFDWETGELLRAFDSSSRADLLLGALGQSGLRFQDADLAGCLIDHLIMSNRSVPDGLDWKSVCRQVPVGDWQLIVEAALQRQSGLLDEQALLTKVLELGAHPWTKFITNQIVSGLRQWMTESKTFLWNLWHYKRLLAAAGYCSPIELLDQLATDWPMHSPVWNQWAPDVERMLRILRFRREMWEGSAGDPGS